MRAENKPLTALTAGDLMTRKLLLLPADVSLRDAAHLLRQAQVSGAPVVDEQGRCMGVLSAADFLRWAEQEGRGAAEAPVPVCPYQVKGRLLTGDTAMICMLGEGNCPLQVMRSTTGGRHIAVCTLSGCSIGDDQQGFEHLPADAVHRYMTADIITSGPDTSLPALARMMIDAHIHRIIVVDDERRPVGVVSSTDLLAALAYSDNEKVSANLRP
jgi:CBS domain-containing protein